MTVFFTASYYGREKYQKYYDLVRGAIEATGVKLISPEKNNYLELVSESEKRRLAEPKKIHYEAIRRGIEKADAVIIEISNEDFQLGHEATIAIQNKKPVLCLSIFDDFSRKITNPYFFGAKYSEYTAAEIIEEFTKRAGRRNFSERFNMFLSPGQIRYLESAGQSFGLNKSEYLRRLIDEDMEKVKNDVEA
jgi:nucleoside 2-deoxyribosyltransferase